MRGIYKSHGAAQTAQARRDYDQLLRLAREAGLSALIPTARQNAGWRALDAAARGGVEKLLEARPDLREVVRRIYPGLVPGDGTLTVKRI